MSMLTYPSMKKQQRAWRGAGDQQEAAHNTSQTPPADARDAARYDGGYKRRPAWPTRAASGPGTGSLFRRQRSGNRAERTSR
jgi:hypothetical protein